MRQLLCMQLDRQPEFGGSVEDPRHLRHGKGDPLAEAVDGIDQPLGMGCAQARNGDFVKVGVGTVRVFGWHGMGCEPAGDDPHRALDRQTARGAQHLQLVLDAQAIAGLDLDGRGALCQQCIQSRQRRREQRILGGGAGGAHRGQDAAAGAGDLLVSRALQPHLEFSRAVAAEDEVGVAVQQRRGNHATAEAFRVALRRLSRAEPLDAPVLQADPAVLDDPPAGAVQGDEARISQNCPGHEACPIRACTAFMSAHNNCVNQEGDRHADALGQNGAAAPRLGR